MLDRERRVEVMASVLTVAVARVSGDWGDDLQDEAARLIEQLARLDPRWMLSNLPALLGAVLKLMDDLTTPPPRTLEVISAEPPQLRALEQLSSGGNHAAVMQRALAGFDRALEQRATDTLTQLDGLLNQVTASEQAARQAAEAVLADLPRRLDQGLAAALTGGAGDVREAVRQAAVTAQREALGQLESVVRTHSDSLQSVVSTENPASPLSALRRDLTAAVDGARRELGEGLAALHALGQAQQAGQAAARKNSAAVGKDWEDPVAVGVASWAQATGDLIEHVGSQPAPGTTRRVGDVLVRIITSTSIRPVLIVEAKRRQRRPSMRAFRES